MRSLGPTVDATLPLVKQLRGLVRPAELRGLARNLHAATPPLARLAKTTPSVLAELRGVSSCATEVIVPFANDKLVDKAFPTHGPVYEDFGKFLPNLAGESRSQDANGPWFKTLVTGGAETLNLAHGIFGPVLPPLAGNNPPPVRTRPPLRPDVPCETQEQPDLRSIPRGVPAAIPNASGTAAREAKAQAAAVAVARAQLKGTGRKVAERSATLDDIRAVARHNGLSKQLEHALSGSAKP